MAMFGSFRKYQKWIWLGGVIVIIPSFVIFFSPDVDFNRTRAVQSYDFGSINGQPITRDEYLPFYNEARLTQFLRTGGRRWPDSEESTQKQLERDALSRLLMVRKSKELGIEVSDLAVGRMAKRQAGDYASLTRFVERELRPHGMGELDYMNFLRHDIAIQQLASVAGLSGKLVNPHEAEVIFRKEYENIHAQAAVFWTSNYLDKFTVTPEALNSFFTNRMQVYREPDTLEVSYVMFAASNYLEEAEQKMAAITNLNDRIDEFYRQAGADAFKDTNGTVLSAEDAKAKILDTERKNYQLREAHSRANDFGNALLELPQPNTAEDLSKVADAKALVTHVTPPFSRTTDPEELGLPSVFFQEAMKLSPQNPIRIEPVVGPDAVYVIAFKNEVKGQIPPFEQIKDKVSEDFKQQKARELATRAGQRFHTTLTNGLAANKSFKDLCQQAQVPTIDLPPFAPASRPPVEGWDERISLSMAQRFAQDLEVGQASRLNPSREGGYILFIQSRSPVEESKLKEDLPEFMDNLRQYRFSQAFDRWLRKAADQARLSGPKPTPEIAPPPEATPAPGTPPAPASGS